MKTPRNHIPTVNYLRFMRHWITGALGVWLIAPALYVALMMGGLFVVGLVTTILGTTSEAVWGLSTVLLLVVGGGAIIGWTIGHIQQDVVRKHLYWDLESWRRTSLVSGVGGAIMTVGIVVNDYDPMARIPIETAQILMPAFVLVLSGGQWWVLRRSVSFAWLWVLANVVGAMLFNHFIVVQAVSAYYTPGVLTLIMVFLGVILQAFVTGHAMIHLVERHGYSPFRAYAKPPRRGDSIWNEAV